MHVRKQTTSMCSLQFIKITSFPNLPSFPKDFHYFIGLFQRKISGWWQTPGRLQCLRSIPFALGVVKSMIPKLLCCSKFIGKPQDIFKFPGSHSDPFQEADYEY